jgi:hypothetical protein
MKKKCEKGLICDSCYHRLDCNDLPHQADFCVLYKKDLEVEDQNASFEDQNADIQKTIEFNNEDLKSLHKKMK